MVVSISLPLCRKCLYNLFGELTMTNPFIAVTDGMNSDIFSQFTREDKLTVHPHGPLSSDELEDILPQVNALIIRSKTHITEELLARAPMLRYIVRAGEGTDNIDKRACQHRGIKVSNTPGANNNSAAEHTVALMMSLLRHTACADADMRMGGWNKSQFVGGELWKKTVGIVGLGRIGTLVAQKLAGFEVEILYYDPYISGTPPSQGDKN